jgi:hypothetical protein
MSGYTLPFRSYATTAHYHLINIWAELQREKHFDHCTEYRGFKGGALFPAPVSYPVSRLTLLPRLTRLACRVS